MDVAQVTTKELKEKLEPLTGIPVCDQELAYDGRIMKGMADYICVELLN